MKNLLNKYIKMNKKGASMMDFFIYALVVLLIGGLVFVIGGIMRGGLNTSQDSIQAVSDAQEGTTADFETTFE